MSSSLNPTLLFLLISFMIFFNEVQARESQFSFFSKTNPSKETQQVYYQDQDHVQHEEEDMTKKNKPIDFTPLSAFKDYTTTTTTTPSSDTNGHGLYGHNADKEAQLTPTTENQASTISNFKPYTTFTYPKPKTNTNTNTNTNANTNTNTNKDLYSGFSGYGMSDTRVMENGKYHYHLTDEERQEALNVKPQNDQVDQWFSYQDDVNNNNNHNNNMYELSNYETNYNPSTTSSGKTKSYGSYGSSTLRNQNGVYYQNNNNNNYNEAGYYYEPSYSKEAGTHEEPDMYVP